jgi:hypothetical protein
MGSTDLHLAWGITDKMVRALLNMEIKSQRTFGGIAVHGNDIFQCDNVECLSRDVRGGTYSEVKRPLCCLAVPGR